MAAAARPGGTAFATPSLAIGGMLWRRNKAAALVLGILLGILAFGWAQRTNNGLLTERNATYHAAAQGYLAVETVRNGVVLSYDAQSVLAGWVGRQIADQDRQKEAAARQQLAEGDRQIDAGLAWYTANSLASTEHDRALDRLRRNITLWRAMTNSLQTGAAMPAGMEWTSPSVVSQEINDDLQSLATIEAQRHETVAAQATSIYKEARVRLVAVLVTLLLAGMLLAVVTVRLAARLLLWLGRSAAPVAEGPASTSVAEADDLADEVLPWLDAWDAELVDVASPDAESLNGASLNGETVASDRVVEEAEIDDLAAAVFVDWDEDDSDQVATTATVGAGTVVTSIVAGAASPGRRTAYARPNRRQGRRQRPPGRGPGSGNRR